MKNYTLLFAVLIFICNTSIAQTTHLLVSISGVKSDKGQLVISVFKDQATYEKLQPAKKLLIDKKKVLHGATTLNIPLEAGIYGVTLLDDENSNGAMDKNVLGMPKEGFGFSNFYLEKMKRPIFEDFKITVTANHDNSTLIKVKYM